MRYLVWITILLSYGSSAQAYIIEGRAIKNEALMTYIKDNMPNHGLLKINKAGHLYLELEKGYINKLNSRLANKDFLPLNNVTDHTLAINPPDNSILTDKLTLIPQIGKMVEFKPIGLYLRAEDDKEFYILSVRIPELKAPHNTFDIKIAVKNLVHFNELAD